MYEHEREGDRREAGREHATSPGDFSRGGATISPASPIENHADRIESGALASDFEESYDGVMTNAPDTFPPLRGSWVAVGCALLVGFSLSGCAPRRDTASPPQEVSLVPSAPSSSPRGHAPSHAGASTHDAHDHGHGHHSHHGFADAAAWAKVFDDPERDAWQRPDEVVRALGLTTTMTVADIGAGTGYFTVRLARAVSAGEVIATDIEPTMVRYLGERAARERLPNVRAIVASQTASGLTARSVDRILVVHVWHHLADRVGYARDLAAALRPGGRLFVVDFDLAGHRGPPAELRLAPTAIIAELAAAGLTARLSPVALPDQYIVEAQREPIAP